MLLMLISLGLVSVFTTKYGTIPNMRSIINTAEAMGYHRYQTPIYLQKCTIHPLTMTGILESLFRGHFFPPLPIGPEVLMSNLTMLPTMLPCLILPLIPGCIISILK